MAACCIRSNRGRRSLLHGDLLITLLCSSVIIRPGRPLVKGGAESIKKISSSGHFAGSHPFPPGGRHAKRQRGMKTAPRNEGSFRGAVLWEAIEGGDGGQFAGFGEAVDGIEHRPRASFTNRGNGLSASHCSSQREVVLLRGAEMPSGAGGMIKSRKIKESSWKNIEIFPPKYAIFTV